MRRCQSCGANNRVAARFCSECAADLGSLPGSENEAWLAATLAAPAPAPRPAQPVGEPPDQKGYIVSQPPPQSTPQSTPQSASATLLGGRYERVAQDDDRIEVIDREPWRRCWACGTTSNESGELFC
ncbi:MAG: protein phosphatase, partial [Roseiflexaceae bacterium]|nr:protein phosphatase [Roseiflexaceae bacterium]